MSSAKPSARNNLIDALKFLAIALVIMSHVLNLVPQFRTVAPVLLRAIVAFNMPLFVVMSGYVLFGREGTNPWRFIRGKALVLLVPFFAWILVELPVAQIPPEHWLQRLAASAIEPRNGFQMWFLWVLFMVFVIFTLGRLVSRSDAWNIALAVAVGLLAFTTSSLASPLAKIAWLYPFLILGYLAAKYRDALRPYDLWIGVAGIVAFPALIAWGAVEGVGLRFLPGVAGVVAAWAIWRLLPRALIDPQAWVGQRTLGIYGGQMVVFPFLIFGAGWVGALTTWAAVLAGATLLAVLLSLTIVTRAVFLGQWPRTLR